MRPTAATRLPGLWGDLLLLIKPGITLLVLVSTALAYLLAHAGPADWRHLGAVLAFTFLLGVGASSLNQFVERDSDGRMARTRNRPLPAGRMRPVSVLAGGLAVSAAGIAGLGLAANWLSAAIGLTVIVTYVLFYTPLKRVTALNTLIGAFPGALPPVLGWAAARGELGREALALFLIQYLWQPPHVLAIAWRHRDDYAAAGMPMITVSDPSGASTRRQVVLYCAVLIPLSAYPAMIGMAGGTYFYGALALSGAFFLCGAAMAIRPTDATAKLVFKASLFYLPALFGLMLYDASPSTLYRQ